MATSDNDDFQFSDEDDFDDKKHDKIVENILNLSKSSQLKKPSRSEPSVQISEFNLVKSATKGRGSVKVDNLALKIEQKARNRLQSTKKKARTLPKPLERPQAAVIKRAVGYEKNRFLLDRWEAFVTSNRAQAHQVFPLDSSESLKVQAKDAANFPNTWTYKSALQKELEKVDPKVEEYHIQDEDETQLPLTLKELKIQRKDMATMRARQSYLEAKARRQNKIKSKKYHRILRKEKIKKKLKEFEDLQQTDPERALKKLEEIEKARALERFNLRHKSTGQWAKSKQIRAKYDKESRQVLAEQLQISRDLTKKQKVSDDSDDELFDVQPEPQSNKKPVKKPEKKAKKVDLTMVSQKKKQIIDEEMIEQPFNEKQGSETTETFDALKSILSDSSIAFTEEQAKTDKLIEIEEFINPKVKTLESAVPGLVDFEEYENSKGVTDIIVDVFEDEDIAQNFAKEKQAEVNKDKPKDIDLNLPGWGSWAGTGINPKKQRKRKRFIVKMPEVLPRRDDNKGSLIINEKASAKVKPHMVSEVPFPFKTVKDYEASIRYPIGNTFVPELAYRRFIRPAVETKMGAIIEPATTTMLMGKPSN